MQRRATATYLLFFLAIAVGAFAVRMSNVAPPRNGGLGAVAVMSALTAVLLVSISYMPVRG